VNERVIILGVPIDAVTHDEVLVRIRAMARSDRQHHIMTPNPEMIVEAQKNPAFLELLQRTDLNIPDGFGLLWAARHLGSVLPERVTGVDLLTSLSNETDLQPIFFLGAADGVAVAAADRLQMVSPRMLVAGTYAGTPRKEEEAEIIRRINTSGARTLFVAYGSPAQDHWIDRVLSQLQGVRIAMGVGGAFDFLAGRRNRAPLFLQRVGLEWLWRLVHEPRRLPRILRAVLVFPFLVLTYPNSRS
jgi:N-acetylglucosaminyldiphosphoundecaprenol N-acetyl-beta-D-mannosaminyltransferase